MAVSGSPARPSIKAQITSDEIDFGQQSLAALSTTFDGTLARQDDEPVAVSGDLALSARYAGEPVSLKATLASRDGTHTLQGLSVVIVDATAAAT
ncbi:MAG: hypothetical protein AcusKO_41750 [Acuticoccus sp.]